MKKIRSGDEIVVLVGKDKGKRGAVKTVYSNDRVLVEGVNVVKKHQKGNPQAGVAPGIVPKEMPIHVSNVALYNPATKKADKVGFKTLSDGKKVRFFKSNSEVVDAV